MNRKRRSDTVMSNDHDTSIQKQNSLISRVRSLIKGQKSFEAQAVLNANPSLRDDRSLAIELAYEEYCRKRETGHAVGVSSFCQRFPSIYRSLYRQLEVDEYIRQNPVMPFAGDVEWPAPGDELFEFLIFEELGRGAFARAYLCSEIGVGNRHVVVKYSLHGAFEANTMGRLSHPNIMPVFSVTQDDTTGTSVICMPFVGRSTLCDVLDLAYQKDMLPDCGDIIQRASKSLASPNDKYHKTTPPVPLPDGADYVDAIISIGIQLANALQHAHENRIIHGDLKPSNIVMTIDGSPMIVDFNLSHDDETEALTAGGTLPYMAPEQIDAVLIKCKGFKDALTERSDVFSLGAVMYELLTGKLPFGRPDDKADDQKEMARIAIAKQESAPRPAHEMNDRVPSRLSDLINRCLEFHPKQRPSSITELAEELHLIQIDARQTQRLTKRRRFLVTAGAVAIPAALSLIWMVNRKRSMGSYLSQAADAIREGNYRSAVTVLDDGLNQDASHRGVKILRAQAMASLHEEDRDPGQLRGALAIFRDLHLEENEDRLVEWKAYCHFFLENHEVALGLLQELSDQQSPSVQNNLGCCHLEKARSLFQKAILAMEKQKTHDAYMKQANEKFKAAYACFKQAIILDPHAFEANLSLASLYSPKGDRDYLTLDEALHAAERAVDANGDHSAEACKIAARLACFKWNTSPSKTLAKSIRRHLERALSAGCHPREFRHYPFKEYLEQENIDLSLFPRGTQRLGTEFRFVKPDYSF